MAFARLLLLIFSLCLHGGLAGALLLFSGDSRDVEERVYKVSLAEFASPQPTAPATPEPPSESPPPPPEPEPAPPEPEPAPEPPKEPEAKPISSKKDKKKPVSPKPVEKPKAPPRPAPVQGPVRPVGPQPSLVGGYATYKQDQVDQRPSISRRAAPEYPNKARRMNIEGKVLVQMVVDTSGMPQSCTVAKAEPPGYFEDAALSAARRMRFIPGKLKGQPVHTLVLLPFAFQLR